MHLRSVPEWLRHAPAPSVRGFALLNGIEAVARGILISVFPLVMYRALQDASQVSAVYFAVGVVSLVIGLLIPWLIGFIPRRFVYIAATLMYASGSLLAIMGTPMAVVIGLVLNTVAVVTAFVCFNAYVLDYISKIEMTQCETSRMFYSALGWTIGPAFGVMAMQYWAPAPFMIAAIAALIQMAVFLFMRLGNGKMITKARRKPPNPLAYMPRFFSQPRLVAGWLFAVIRSCAWWVYVVYLPIFAIEAGLGDQIGGITLSITNGALFVTPFMLRWIKRNSIRAAVRLGFLVSAGLFTCATVLAGLPSLAVLCLMAASFFLILLDVSAGLPFLLAVKPSERTEMSAIYSSFRDVSGIITPGAAWLVLLVAPLSGIFVASAVSLLAMWHLSGRLSPRLGKPKSESVLVYAGVEGS